MDKKTADLRGNSVGCERKLGGRPVFIGRVGMGMRAAGAAGLGTGAQRLVDDCLDGPCATTAFGTTAEAAINLLGVACRCSAAIHGGADIVVAEDVTGADNHLRKAGPSVMLQMIY